MDLLGQENSKEQKSQGKKIVLTLLIIASILLIVILIAMFTLQGNKEKTLGLKINGKDTKISENMLISDESGNTYISIEELAQLIGYDYIKGGYLEYNVDENKGYIETINQVIEYEVNSTKIYKVTPNSVANEEYYNLNNKIIKKNDTLYIALEDLNVGCNVVYMFSEQEYKIIINTTENLISEYQEKLTEQKLKINNNFNNQRALPYNMMVVSNESEKIGVIDFNQNSLIGYKYSTMQFDECSQNFIVSNENKYGVISREGKVIIETKYENVRIINYSPLLYEVKINNKYGVLDETGKLIINIEYDKIGFNEQSNLTEPVIIIKKLENNQNGIVVCKNNKYGIINLETKRVIIECETSKIYAKPSNSKEKEYYVQLEDTEIELNRYIEYINTTTVVTN